MPESSEQKEVTPVDIAFNNEWISPFGKLATPPSESQSTLKRLLRRVIFIKYSKKI